MVLRLRQHNIGYVADGTIVILSSVVTAGYALVSCCWLIYGGCACGWCRGGDVLVSNNCFLQQNTTASLLELYFNDSVQTVYACVGGGGGSQQREVADGADVVFTDTDHWGLSKYYTGAVVTL